MFVWVDKKYVIYFIENDLVLIYIIHENGTSHDLKKSGTTKRNRYNNITINLRVIPTVIEVFFLNHLSAFKFFITFLISTRDRFYKKKKKTLKMYLYY